jgi:transglutaminase-like putative cysteine protease
VKGARSGLAACAAALACAACGSVDHPRATSGATTPGADASTSGLEQGRVASGPRSDGGSEDGSPSTVPYRAVFLGEIPIEKRSGGPLDGHTAVRLGLRATLGAPVLGELTRRGVRHRRSTDTSELSLRGYPRAHARPTPKDRAASFLVDYDDPEVHRVREEAARELGPRPSMSDLARFVHRFIVTKDLLRAYDPASVVARRREGDCTEHAVLLAALGRAFGFPTRVVHGVVIIDGPARIVAGGHAWVEWSDGSEWIEADAALPAEASPIYLPLQIVKDEGPSYGKGLILTMPQELGPMTVEAE